MKQSKLKEHSHYTHPQNAKDKVYLKSSDHDLKQGTQSRRFTSQKKPVLEASIRMALKTPKIIQIPSQKHSETMFYLFVKVAKLKKAYIALSNDNIYDRIKGMSEGTRSQVAVQIRKIGL
jgi:hypothetical protein